MEYYGNLNNMRLAVVAEYKPDDVYDATTEIGYLNSKGMFFDYVLKNYYEGTVWSNVKGECKPCEAPRCVVVDSFWKGMKRIKRNKKFYYVGQRSNDRYGVYMELPRIESDGVFEWKKNGRYGTLEATLERGTFEYLCVVKTDGNAFIEVKYTKRDNKHRNNVTIARIDVYNASNQDILDAIEMWKREITRELMEVIA